MWWLILFWCWGALAFVAGACWASLHTVDRDDYDDALDALRRVQTREQYRR